MGCHQNVGVSKFPKQSVIAGKRVEVIFDYDSSKVLHGVIVRADSESPFRLLIRLDDGRFVDANECHYRAVDEPVHSPVNEQNIKAGDWLYVDVAGGLKGNYRVVEIGECGPIIEESEQGSRLGLPWWLKWHCWMTLAEAQEKYTVTIGQVVVYKDGDVWKLGRVRNLSQNGPSVGKTGVWVDLCMKDINRTWMLVTE